MVFENVAYKNVICLGHILDAKGEKMSKSKGNIVDPWEVMNLHGADAMRWYLYTSSQPGEPRRFSMDLVGEVVKKLWSTLWNTYSFFVTYANLDGWTPAQAAPAVSERDPLDRWVLAELHQLTRDVTDAYERYDVTSATRPIQVFVESLSNWYVRLSRRRFWKGEGDAEKLGAYATLYECLVTVSKLLAPSMPLLADKLYRNLVLSADPTAPESVHLGAWPVYDAALIDQRALDEMRVVERLVSLGRAARDNAEIGVRQPLATATFVLRERWEAEALHKLADLVTGELNVKALTVADDGGAFVNYALNPLPSMLGKKFGKDFPKVQKALREGAPDDVRRWARALLAGQTVSLTLDDVTYDVTPAECEVKQSSAEGYAVAEDAGYLAALDTTLTEDLMLEGLAREVVRRVQSTRKEADFEIEDSIAIVYDAGERLSKAIEQFADYIREETLAVSLERRAPENGFFRADFAPSDDPKQDTSVKGERLSLGVKRAARA
jgi:isoleucyl-tRNA synthetase